MTPTYDIFISYRRDAFDSANLFATRLKALGYRVFFDVETMNAGKFNEQLLDVISKCKDFILVLSPNALDRCSDEQDWVRREVMCAMEHKKNIIPIMLSGFEWPKEMPNGLEELCLYQALAPLPNIYYDMQIKKLQGYLQSKAHFQTRRKWIVGLSITAAVLLLCFSIAKITYLPVATRVAESASLQMQTIEEYLMEMATLDNDWNRFLMSIDNANTVNRHQQLVEDYSLRVRQVEKNLEEINNQHEPFILDDISDFHVLVFWTHGITPTDFIAYNQFREELYLTIQTQFIVYDTIMSCDMYSAWDRMSVEMGSKTVKLLAESYYYSYLQLLSHLPQSAQESFYKMSPYWSHLPNNIGLNLPDEEYDRLQKYTDAELMNVVNALQMATQKAELEVEQIETRLDQMNQAIDRILDSIQQ